MALPASGAIRMGADIGVELGNTATSMISIGATAPRTLAGVPSGAIRVAADFYGKSTAFVFNQTISSDTTNYNIKSAAIAAGWDQTKPLIATVTINAGVYVYSTSTGSYAFDTGSSFFAGSTLALINNGIILGRGGDGGTGGLSFNVAGTAGGTGGPAFIARYAINVTNNGTIGGGGGGGGGGSGDYG